MASASTIQRVGIIGGGQLAWMMGPAAQRLGLDLVVQTPNRDDPAVAIAQEAVFAAVADSTATQTLARQCDVITFENEFIDGEALQRLAQGGVTFRPGLEVLDLVLDKGHQRDFFQKIGLPNPRYAVLEGNEDDNVLHQRAADLGFPLVMKTRRLGYDGYGTVVIQQPEDLVSTWDRLRRVPVLLEEFVPFTHELAILVARSASGEIAVYPTVETQQVNQICRRVVAPAPIDLAVAATMADFARTLVDHLHLVGIVAMECFLTAGGRVLVNEIAPRTHNSGHYSLDACATSQFEQQLRAVSDRPLGPTTLTGAQAVMVNLLGLEESEDSHRQKLETLKALPDAHLYWYNKGIRPGRKLGHLTRCLGAGVDPNGAIAEIESLWYGA